jgi:diadenosine tetraphosphatase ApaH/serine/threonine PP2A family protein phosphatase
MKVAVFSDVHANLEALEAVLADIRAAHVDEIYCLGDVIGYGADPGPCVRRVRETCRVILRGNHETALLDESWLPRMNPAAAQALRWTARQLDARDVAEIGQWPLVRAGADARLVHGTPNEPAEFHYLQGRFSLEEAFRAFPEPLCFCGHTHIPLIAEEIVPERVRIRSGPKIEFEDQPRYVINVGSVGQPRDGRKQARWVLVEDRPAGVEFRAVEYDIAGAQAKIHKAGLPEILASRLSRGE